MAICEIGCMYAVYWTLLHLYKMYVFIIIHLYNMFTFTKVQNEGMCLNN